MFASRNFVSCLCGSFIWLLQLAGAFACASIGASTGMPVAGFTSVGIIESFSLDTPGDPLSGGKIVVNGTTIQVPCNLIVQMPASFLTPNDIFRLNPADRGGPTISGLALDDAKAFGPGDTRKPLAPHQANVIGNIVNGKYLAGLVYISPDFVAAGTGFIKSIDMTTGMMRVGADPSTPVSDADAYVQLNDANGVYGMKITQPKAPDSRFTVDTENPTVRSATGYPMCVPRSATDAECPASNRGPNATPYMTFIMGRNNAIPFAPVFIPTCPKCDPTKQAPFVKGDYITYSGRIETSGTLRYISAHTVVADVGIYTDPASSVNYLAIEESKYGALGPFNPVNPQEGKDMVLIRGNSTNVAKSVALYAVDVNPSTGAETLRFLLRASLDRLPLGRFRRTVVANAGDVFTGSISGFLSKGAPREILAHIEAGPYPELHNRPVPKGPKVANGLVANQYRAPVGEFVFPELLVPGSGATRVLPNNFECLGFLQQGSGPLTTADNSNGPVVGRLNPWPGSGAPGPVFCGP